MEQKKGVSARNLPWAHDEADECADVAAAADVDEARQQGGHIRAGGDGVGGDVGTELSEGKSGRDHEDAKALGGADARLVQELLEKVQRVPDCGAEDHHRGRRDNDADKGCDGEADGNREQLGPEGIARLLGETSKIGIVYYQCSKVGYGAHDAFHHLPGEFASVDGVALVYDWSNALRSHDGPDKEGDASGWDDVGLDGKQMPDLVYWRVDEW